MVSPSPIPQRAPQSHHSASTQPGSPPAYTTAPFLNPCSNFEARAHRATTISSSIFIQPGIQNPRRNFPLAFCKQVEIAQVIVLLKAHVWEGRNQRLKAAYLEQRLLQLAAVREPKERTRLRSAVAQLRNAVPLDQLISEVEATNPPSTTATMPSSCADIRSALAACLQSSDCIMIDRHTPSECLRSPLLESLPTKCQQLKKGYGECKRGMVDMRKRFRGNQPVAVSQELEGEKGGQLYGGRKAFPDVVKKTEGNEPEERDWREVENEKFRDSLLEKK